MEVAIGAKGATGCEAFSEIDPSHPVKDRYCCTPSAFGSMLHDVYQSDDSLALQRALQTDCFP